MIAVTLTPQEVAAAVEAGDRRAAFHDARGRGDQGFTNHEMSNSEMHRQGTVSEYALAKHLGPAAVAGWWGRQAFAEDFKSIKADVGDKYQVRATVNPGGGLLLTEGKDDPDQIFVLARLHELDRNVVFLVGWAYAADAFVSDSYARRARQLRLRCSHLMPASDLEPMESLP